MPKLAQRTQQFIDAFKKDGSSASLPKVDIVNAPWHKGYQNKSMQNGPSALVSVEECKRGKILEGCSSVQYNINNEVVVTNDKRSVPVEYRDAAIRIVDISKMKDKFGDNWTNVYYNLQDKAAILSQPEDIIKKSFDRFVKDQIKEANNFAINSPAFHDYSDEDIADFKKALGNQYANDFESGEYLNYSEDIIGHFPGGAALSEKRKEHIAEYRSGKKEKAGLDVQTIAYAMGGSIDSKPAKDAGIVLLSFDTEKFDGKKQSSIGATLMKNIPSMTDYVEELVGDEESRDTSQKIFISKDVVDEVTGKTSIALLYAGISAENKAEIPYAVRDAIKDTLPSNVNVDISDTTYQPLESQVENAKDHYSLDTGSWMSDKSLRKPIIDTTNVQLLSELVSESNVNDKSVGMDL